MKKKSIIDMDNMLNDNDYKNYLSYLEGELQSFITELKMNKFLIHILIVFFIIYWVFVCVN